MDIPDDDVEVTLSDVGTTTPSDLIVPSGKVWLDEMIVVVAATGQVTGAGVGMVRLANGLEIGNQEIPLGGYGGTLATTHATPAFPVHLKNLGIKAKTGGRIKATAWWLGADCGDATAIVSFGFKNASKAGSHWYQCREAALTTIDTAVEVAEPAGATKKWAVPGNVGNRVMCDRIIVAHSSDNAATEQGGAVLALSGNGIKDDQAVVLGASGGYHATEAVGHFPVLDLTEQEIECVGGNEIKGEATMVGIDHGSDFELICLGFRV
jgi:hypothetical protein